MIHNSLSNVSHLPTVDQGLRDELRYTRVSVKYHKWDNKVVSPMVLAKTTQDIGTEEIAN